MQMKLAERKLWPRTWWMSSGNVVAVWRRRNAKSWRKSKRASRQLISQKCRKNRLSYFSVSPFRYAISSSNFWFFFSFQNLLCSLKWLQIAVCSERCVILASLLSSHMAWNGFDRLDPKCTCSPHMWFTFCFLKTGKFKCASRPTAYSSFFFRFFLYTFTYLPILLPQALLREKQGAEALEKTQQCCSQLIRETPVRIRKEVGDSMSRNYT